MAINAQREGRRRSGRRKPTTESPLLVEDQENEQNPQKLDTEPEATAKSSSAQPTEAENNASPSNKEQPNGNQGGPPFIVPRGTRKPRPHVRNNGVTRPRPTLPTFARKRGPKPERQDFKKIDENSDSTPITTTTKPSRTSSRNRSSNSEDRNTNVEKPLQTTDDLSTESAPKKRFGGDNRRLSRGSRRQNAATSES